MKLLGKKKDQAIGNLLRAYASRPTSPQKPCTDFDPDLAGAYIERRLTTPTRTQYEAHLSQCDACRKAVVTLSRLAEAESLTAVPQPRMEGAASWLAPVETLLRRLSAPQWAMAAAAVVVLAISLPLLLSGRAGLDRAANNEFASEPAASGQPATAAGPRAATAESEDARLVASDSPQRQTRGADTSSASGMLAANKAPAASGGDRAESEESKKSESNPQSQPVDQVRIKAESQVVSPAAAQPGQALGENQQAKVDSDRARQQEKDVAQSEPKPAPPNDERAEKEKAGRVDQAAAAPAPPERSRVAESRSSLPRSRGKLGLRDSSGSESVRTNAVGREFGSKRFFLRDGTWTDKDYNPDKNLPTITLVRDSNVYKEVAGKRTKLKPYLDYFSETERAIIVFKGTVYKLIPQQSDK